MSKLLIIFLSSILTIYSQTNHSLSFDETADVEIPINDIFEYLDDFSFTIALKLNTDDVLSNLTNSDATHFLVNKDHHPDYSNGSWSLRYYKNTETDQNYLAWGIDLDGSGNIEHLNLKTELVSILDDEWHHIAGTRDASTGELKFYIDGELVDSGSSGNGFTMYSPNKFVLGRHVFLDACRIYGLLDDFTFWNSTLTQNQVNYNYISNLSGNEDALIGFWNMNEGEGSTLIDLSGNGNNGIINSATWSTDVPTPPTPPNNNYSLSFDGGDDYVLIAEASSYIQNSDASLMGWFKINEFDGLNPLFGFRNYPDDYCSMYAVMGTNGTIETMVYGNLQSFNSGHDANQWYHLAMVFNSQTETFNTYVNGELGSSIATPSSIFDCRDIDLLIGGMQIGNFETLNGSIDDVSLWDVSLTQDDIQAHMNTELSGDETGLAGYWNFNEGEGSILTDLSDNRIDGDIIGATWSDDGAPVMPGSIASLEVGLVQGYPNSEVSVPVHIDLMQQSLSSLEISFSGFQDHMEFLDLELEGAMIGDAEWDVVLNNQEDLLLTLSYGANEISGEGVLFNLKFNIPEQAETDFVPIMIEQVQLDELDGSIEILNGGVQINAIVWGDVSQNGDVSGYDASLILKYLVGSEELDETQLHVADVTQDATISALDASAVAQYVVQLIDVLPLEDPSSISGGGEFYFRDTELIPGEMLEIPIELTNGENLLSFEFSAEYDESVFTVEEVIWSDLINHFTIEDNLVPGSINIAGMGTSPDGAEGTFGTIRLYVNPEFSDQNSSINLSYRINESVPVDNINIIIPNSSLGVDHTLTPKVFTLHQNYPNPFNPTTQIKYDLPSDSYVSISIYDVMGRRIKSLSNANQTAGYHSLQWDATNDIGEGVSAGMYIYTIQAGGYRATKKMVLLK